MRWSFPVQQSVVLLVGTLALLLLTSAALVRMRHPGGLVYQDQFGSRRMAEWKVYGGNWLLIDDTLTNDSDDTGAKVVTGNPDLKNVAVDADVRLTSSFGDAGLLVRVSDAEEGTNAFNGYYAGLRLPNQLLLSRMDFGFTPLQRVVVSQGIHAGVWYHLRLVAQGCRISAEAQDESGMLLAKGQVLDDSTCLQRGQFGLRSYAAGGSWRKIKVQSLP